jgi:ABC-type phosphate/phosphonate transport system substrate-binding protein
MGTSNPRPPVVLLLSRTLEDLGLRAPAFGAVVVAAAVVLSGAGPLLGQNRGPAAMFNYGVSTTTIAEVNTQDVLAGTVFLGRAFGKAVGVWSDAQAVVFHDTESMVGAVNSDAVDVMATSTIEYLTVERQLKGDPFLLYEISGEVFQDYVLVARDGIQSVADLAGKRVAVFNPSPQRDLGDTWLDVLLMESGLPDSSRTLAQVKLVKRRSQGVTAAFFGQVDAAVEPRSSFETSIEMNPQVGKRLHVVAKTPALLQGLVIVRRSMNPDLRRRFIETAARMHESPQFRQTFLVMHVNRIVPFQPRDMANTRQLNDRYLALRKGASVR